MPDRRGGCMKFSLLAALAIVFCSTVAVFGHGSMADPISRAYWIFLENPQTPQREVSQAAIAVAGTQAFYDWNEVNGLFPARDYLERIPDGQLASAGRAKYAGLDLVRNDWPATSVAAGPYECVFYATTPHDPSVFTAYVTSADYDPTQPLRWEDLEELEMLTPVTLEESYYRFTVNLPNRTGKHLLYVIWQRDDPAGEAFFSTSDIDFGGGSPDPQPELPSPEIPAPPPITGPCTKTPCQCSVLPAETLRINLGSTWNGGFVASVTVTNTTGQSLREWIAEFDLPADIVNLWDAKLIAADGNRYSVSNESWNGTLAPGATTTFGFQASGSSADAGTFGTPVFVGLPVGGDTSQTSLYLTDTTVDEGNDGVTVAQVTFGLNEPAASDIVFQFATQDGSAQAGEDYLAASGSITIPAGVVTGNLDLEVIGDTSVEPEETFSLEVTDVQGAICEFPSATVTILNDDTTVPQPTPQPTPDDACLHTVAASENLFRLAILYDTTVDDFLQLNDLDTDLIRVGQVLSIPNCGASE